MQHQLRRAMSYSPYPPFSPYSPYDAYGYPTMPQYAVPQQFRSPGLQGTHGMPVARAVPYVQSVLHTSPCQPRVVPNKTPASQKRAATLDDAPETPRANKTPRAASQTPAPQTVDMGTQTDLSGPVVTLAESKRLSQLAADKATTDARSVTRQPERPTRYRGGTCKSSKYKVRFAGRRPPNAAPVLLLNNDGI